MLYGFQGADFKAFADALVGAFRAVLPTTSVRYFLSILSLSSGSVYDRHRSCLAQVSRRTGCGDARLWFASLYRGQSRPNVRPEVEKSEQRLEQGSRQTYARLALSLQERCGMASSLHLFVLWSVTPSRRQMKQLISQYPLQFVQEPALLNADRPSIRLVCPQTPFNLLLGFDNALERSVWQHEFQWRIKSLRVRNSTLQGTTRHASTTLRNRLRSSNPSRRSLSDFAAPPSHTTVSTSLTHHPTHITRVLNHFKGNDSQFEALGVQFTNTLSKLSPSVVEVIFNPFF